MLTGGGRLIAGDLTDELRRKFERNEKFGKVYPLAYLVVICPKCLYASYPMDFNEITIEEIEKIRTSTQSRIDSIKKFFGGMSFENNRNLTSGAASFLLSVDCYTYRDRKVAPTFKKAISSIRAAWLFDDLFNEINNPTYKKISDFFYWKAYGFYHQALKLVQTGGELMDGVGNLGPDYDKNWGYNGLLYMCAILTVKIGSKEPLLERRINNFEVTKRYLSKLFGSGKTSKSKPGPLVDMIRDLYTKINEMLDQWYQEMGERERLE